MSPSDAALARRAAAGDRAAFEEILERCEASVYRFALALMRSPDDAADMAQDAFVVFLRNPGAYDPARGTLRSFLLGVVRHLCFKEIRRRSRRAAPVAEVSAEAPAGNACEEASVREVLSRSIAALPDRQRAVLELRFEERMDLLSIAEAMRLPLNTVKSHMKRALDRLRATLNPEEL